MSSKRWLFVSSLAVSVVVACAEAEDPKANPGDEGGGSESGGTANAGAAGKLAAAGTSVTSQGGKAGGASSGGGSGKGGTGSGGAAGSGGKATGGAAGTSSGGRSAAGSSTGGNSTAGTGAGGTASTGLSCTVEAAAGAPGAGGADVGAGGADVGAGGVDAGGAGMGAGGAPALADLFFDDFESGSASKWANTLGTWALVDDGSKTYDQSVQENKLQIAIANGVCVADQIIDARVKVIGFKGQSNSYVAALFGRVLGPTTHYLLALGSDGKLALRKRVNSSSTGATAIGSAVALNITAGNWYDVHFEIVGTALKGCVGAVCVTGTDSSIASGSVAVGTVNTSARFDDVRLTTP